MGVDRLVFVQDGPEPPAGPHCLSQGREPYSEIVRRLVGGVDLGWLVG